MEVILEAAHLEIHRAFLGLDGLGLAGGGYHGGLIFLFLHTLDGGLSRLRLYEVQIEVIQDAAHLRGIVRKDHQFDIVPKITNPHFKKLYRFFGNDTGKAIADYLCVFDETVDDTKDIEIFDPEATWKRKTVYNFKAKELMVPIFKNGELVYKLPTLPEIKAYCQQQIDTLWDEVKRFDNPHTYYVDLSQKLWQIKYDLLREKTF